MSSQDLLKVFPRAGRVEWIGLSPGRRESILTVAEADVEVGTGLVGDHHARTGRGERQVTLIQAEHFSVLSSLMGRDVTPEMMRRNVVVAGINLNALKNRPFRIGDVQLRGTGPCPPCSRIEEALGPGGLAAAFGHAGITASVVAGGRIRVGDEVHHGDDPT